MSSTNMMIEEVVANDASAQPLAPKGSSISIIQLKVANGNPLGLMTIAATTLLFGLMMSHIDSMWLRGNEETGGVLANGEHYALPLICLLLKWFTMSALFVSGALQALNCDNLGATAYWLNGMTFGAMGYMLELDMATQKMHAVGYALYALFYCNAIIAGGYAQGGDDTKLLGATPAKTVYASVFGLLALWCLTTGLRFTESFTYEENKVEDQQKYDKTGDMISGIVGILTALVCALACVPLVIKTPKVGGA